MVKSRRASKALPARTHCYSPTHLHVQEGSVAMVPTVAEAFPASDRPPSRSPGCRRVRDELGKLTRLGIVLNYSDEQSSNNEEDDDVEPTSPASEARCLSHPTSSPELGHKSASTTHPDISDRAGSIGPILVTDLKETLASSAFASDAALAFQRWRISSLKALFTQDLEKVLTEAQQNEARLLALEEDMEKKEKHLVHALADSAQLRAQLCALESVSEHHHHQETSDMEALQADLVKALERATSSEAEVERYNKEIRKLRERLKSTEDEASRLDSELKATVLFLEKEKDGVAKENRVLLEQLARKDEEVLSQAQEINSLKSVLACLRVSQLELERLKHELQGTSVQRMKNATPETMGNGVLQGQMGLKYHLPKESADLEEPSGPVLSRLLDILQKLTVCLQKNETQLEPCGGKGPESGKKQAISSDLPQKGARYLEAAADCKPMNCAGQVSSSLHLKSGTTKGFQLTSSNSDDLKGNKLFAVTCWKWRWVAAASGLQALSKEISMLKSVGKDKAGSVQQASFISCLDNIQKSLIKECLQKTEHPSVDLQAPLSSDKVLALLTSIWKLSSQSAYQEKEAFHKGKQFNHLLRVMTRWMQRAVKRRQLERVITHWLRYLLHSWKDKFKYHYTAALAPAAPADVPNLTSTPKPRKAESLLLLTKKGYQKPGKDRRSSKHQALETLQESLHHSLECLEASIMKEASYWHQQLLGDGDGGPVTFLGEESVSTNLVWKICCELERCFSDTRNQIMAYFGVLNTEKKIGVSAFSSKPLVQIKVGSSKKPVERGCSPQAIARKRRNIFI